MNKNAFGELSVIRHRMLAYTKPEVEIYNFWAERGFELSTDSDLEDFYPENQI